MPSDANGVYSLPSGYLATTGETIQASQHNPPLEDLASAMSARLMRSGAAPMTGGFKIIDGSVGSPAVRFNSDSSTGFYKTPDGIGASVGGTKVGEFTADGILGSRWIGELIPWTLTVAHAKTVFPVGQTLSRTTYADLWAVAQIEISNGNSWFNNGDGSNTFGIGDMRGCTLAAKDNMGGTAASRLSTFFTGGTSTQLGSRGGGQGVTIPQNALPNIAPAFSGIAGTVTVTSTTNLVDQGINGLSSGGGSNSSGVNTTGAITSTGTFTPSGTVASINGNVTQQPISAVQPTMICNFLLYAGA